MKITIDTAKLTELTDIATRFIAKNATLPILQNIYIKASIDSLIIRATDMEKYIEIETPCTVASEGAITVNGKTFSDFMRTIEEQTLEISADETTHIMTVNTTKDTIEINGIAANEYVALPEIPQENKISVDIHAFSKGIEKVEYAVTEKNFSPVLTGVLIKYNPETSDKLTFVGTDSFRLAEFKAPSSKHEKSFSLIIPKISITDVQRIAEYARGKGTEELSIQYSENLISFQCMVDSTRLLATSLLIQGNFPDYDREEIVPRSFNTTIIVDKTLCEKAIKKIGILTRDINNFIQIETSNDSIVITSGKTDKGAGTTSIPAIIEGENVSLGINGKYITDFIRLIEGEEMIFNIVDNHKPLILIDKNDGSYKYVVRPLINN